MEGRKKELKGGGKKERIKGWREERKDERMEGRKKELKGGGKKERTNE